MTVERAAGPMPAPGPRAAELPAVVVLPLADDASVVDLVGHAISRSVAQIIEHDPGVRVGDDPEDVHQLRVATRRLRSDLRSFRPMLDWEQLAPVRDELKWLGGQVGAVRDVDVLAQRLGAASLELPPHDQRGAARLLGRLASEHDAARDELLAALRDPRYVRLVDALVALAGAPPFVEEPEPSKGKPARRAARLVRRPWKHLASAVAELGPDPADAELHQVRIRAKRCRYAAEAVAPLVGKAAARFADAVADVQTVLGDHQDTVFAETWLRTAAHELPSTRLAAGQLISFERSTRRELRDRWPAAWKVASAKKLRRWL